VRAIGWTLLNTGQALFLASWSVLWISTALVVSIFSGERPLWLARHAWAPGLAWAAMADLERVPGATLAKGQPYVVVMNHQSMFDIVTAFALVPVNLRFVAKAVLKYIPFLGWYMWRTRMIFVDRSNRMQAIRRLKRAGDQVRRGAVVLAYAEGTRSTTGAIMPFKKGPFMLAVQAQVPVVPLAIEGADKVLPAGGFRLRPGKVKLRIGEPIPTAGLALGDVEYLMKQVRDALIDLHVSIGGPGGDKETCVALPGEHGVGRRATLVPPNETSAGAA